MKTITRFFVAAAICTAFASCSNKPAAQAVQPAEQENVETAKPDPVQLITIGDEFLKLMQSTHISNADDASKFMVKYNELKDKTEELTKEINDMIPSMNEEEKEKLVEEVKTVQQKLDEINAQMEKERERVEKEAKDAGVDLNLDFDYEEDSKKQSSKE